VRTIAKLCPVHILSLGLAGWLVCSCSATTAKAEYPRQSRSLWWEPYGYDAGTCALFHLDEKGKTEKQIDFDAEPKDGDADLIDGAGGLDADVGAMPGSGGEAGRTAGNAVPGGQVAQLMGDCEFVESGRFGGGLGFSGGDGKLYCKGLQAKDGCRNVEFWLKLEEYPETEAVLVQHAPPPRRGPGRYQAGEWNRSLTPLSLVVKPDGSLELAWFDKRQAIPSGRVPAKRWVHVALCVTDVWPHRNAVYLYLAGRLSSKVPFDRTQANRIAYHSEACLLGNDGSGDKGIKGLIDEIRVSRTFRRYYPCELDWVHGEPGSKIGYGQPYFRDRDDLLFHLDLNGTLKPARCATETDYPSDAITQNDIEFNPAKVAATFPVGVQGRGLMLGKGSLRPAFSARGNIVPEQGTIAFWMLPVDWDNFTRDSRFDAINPTAFGLFQLDCTTVPGSHEAIFHKVFPLLQFTVNIHLPEAVNRPTPLQPGVWTHVTATWKGGDIRYYINGERRNPEGALRAGLEIRTAGDPYPYRKANPRWWSESKPVRLRFQENRYRDDKYWKELGAPKPRTVIDDFRIYRRPLAPSEIRNLVRLYDARQEVEPLPEADMQLYWNGVSGVVRADLIPLTKSYNEVTAGRLTVRKAGDPTPVGQATAEFGERRQGTVEVRTPPLEFAKYEVLAELLDGKGNALASVRDSFTRKPPPWWENKLGVSDKPLPEWDPVVIKGNLAKISLRQIRLGGSGLPASIVSAGEEVLAGPVYLDIRSGGRALSLRPGKDTIDVVRHIPARCDWKGSLSSEQLSVNTNAYLEFDGMMWFDVTLRPAGQKVSIDALELRIPYREDAADLVHWWSGRRNFRNRKYVRIGALPDREGVLFRSNDGDTISLLEEMRGSFIPYVMLTGDLRGMAWFAENDRGWTQSREIPAASIVRDGETVTLVLKIVSESTELPAEGTFSFGLHPIPVRKVDPLWRQYPVYSNVYPDTFCGNNLKGRKGPTSFYLYPEDDWEAVKRRINGEGLTKGAAGLKGLYRGQMASLKSKGITDPPPQSLTVPGLYWDTQWNGMPRLEHTREWSETWAPDYQYYTPEFIDFVAWAWNDWIEKTDKFVRGAYMDDCWGAPLTKAGGPVTYTLPDGHTQPGFQFRGYRERFKRMRQICHDHGIWPHITSHTTHTLLIPYHSFFDLILDGEDKYSSPPTQHDFIDHWPLDRMRFMHNAKWGLVTTWLAWHGNSLRKEKWPSWTFRQTRAYVAHMAQHDILWGFAGSVVDRFGLKEPGTEFIPYWQPDGPVKVSDENVKPTVWKRAGKCLLLLANVGEERAEAIAGIDLKRLGLSPGEPSVSDADPSLLTYFKEDITADPTPKAPKATSKLDDADDLGFEEDPEKELELTPDKLPLAERRAQDPDGKFEWADGVLKCPVRRHDYRLFLLRQAKE